MWWSDSNQKTIENHRKSMNFLGFQRISAFSRRCFKTPRRLQGLVYGVERGELPRIVDHDLQGARWRHGHRPQDIVGSTWLASDSSGGSMYMQPFYILYIIVYEV